MTTPDEAGRAVLCVIQARTGSTRLPGKVLRELGGVPMLEFMLRRLETLGDHLDDTVTVVVATSDLDRDDPIVDIAERCGVPVVRGSERDVLARFATAVAHFPAPVVVRLTADCPLTDPAIVAAVVQRHRATSADYTSNVLPRSFPKGLDVEVIATDALLAADRDAVDAAEREHVTPFVYRRPERFRLANLDSGVDAGDERWTVDTAEDLEWVRSMVATAGDPRVGWQTLLAQVGRRAAPVPVGTVVLRAAVLADGERLLEWRNDPEAVRWSGSGRAVAAHEHRAWFERVLADPGHRLRIAVVDGVDIGMVRVDVEAGVGTVSIAVAPSARGRGFGRQMLRALAADVRADCQVRELVAAVHSENLASVRAFANVGYHDLGVGPDGFLRLGCAA